MTDLQCKAIMSAIIYSMRGTSPDAESATYQAHNIFESLDDSIKNSWEDYLAKTGVYGK